MGQMQEIYADQATAYDALVNREDWQGNLGTWLAAFPGLAGSRVLECGAGTGRLSALLLQAAASVVCLDREEAMLAALRKRLAPHAGRFEAPRGDNCDLSAWRGGFQAVAEGWSFGHTVLEHRERIPGITAELVEACRSCLSCRGPVIIIESLGTMADAPEAPGPGLAAFYRELEDVHGFSRTVISTDYRFESATDAARIMGHFFGPDMHRKILQAGSAVVPEFTGIWHRDMEPPQGRG